MVPLAWILCLLGTVGVQEDSKPGGDGLPTIGEKTDDLTERPGLMTVYLDEQRGKLWLKVPPATGPRGEVGRYVYVAGLLSGMGSNPVGLDRGRLGGSRLVVFRRMGGRLLVEEVNLRYRALSDDAAERRAVDHSFATSILWGGEFAAMDPDGSVLVDFTSFVLRDAAGIARALKSTEQGSYTLDRGRSAIDLQECRVFERNVELEGVLTFGGSEPGPHARETVPSAESLTLTVHHSFLALPEDGYTPRRFDPRIGMFAVSFLDYATPLDEPLEKRWIVRHRLEKVDPSAARSRVKEPIVYHVDPGAPEPVRSALIEGASWWAEAFEAAGFIDAYRVELLPEGAHPLDARYNVIQWVHRSTRGWSYGGGVRDPRTGEMIKGHVTLGSLRVRQDRLLFEGLLGTEKTGSGDPDGPIEVSLARIRQLAAHEVGHTLGLAHNFAASVYGRASVMDYPAPLIQVRDDGSFDVSSAYGVGMGEWDVHCIRYAYSQFPPGADEDAELDAIVLDGLRRNLIFMSDADARPGGAAHPLANLWDNGADPVEGLKLTLRVRELALGRFGERNIAPGRPVALLEEVLAPLYFHHRYQLDAAVKKIGGLDYRYAVRGDGQAPARPLPGEEQREALTEILKILEPAQLDLPESVLALLAPRPFGHGSNRELFGGRTGLTFDPLAAAATASQSVIAGILHPHRCARLVDQHRREASAPGLGEILRIISQKVFDIPARDKPRHAEIRRVIRGVLVEHLVRLGENASVPPEVRARVDDELRLLVGMLPTSSGSLDADLAHRAFLRAEIERHFSRTRPDATPATGPPPPPPGSPIGTPQGSGGTLGSCRCGAEEGWGF